MNYQQLSPIFL